MLDTEPLYQAAWQRAAEALGYALDDEFYLTLIGTPTKDALKKVGAYFGPTFPLQRFTKLGADHWYRASGRTRHCHQARPATSARPT